MNESKSVHDISNNILINMFFSRVLIWPSSWSLLIKLRMEIRNVAKWQQPDLRAEKLYLLETVCQVFEKCQSHEEAKQNLKVK